jgi:uncharacterized membrane protein
MVQFLLSFLVMMGLDGVWLGWIAKKHYYEAYGHVLRIENQQLQPIWWSALMVYVLLVFGVYYYGLSYAKESTLSAVLHSALFGLIVYGVYDFTCLALFRDWPLLMTLLDWLWGGVLCGLTAYLVLLIA